MQNEKTIGEIEDNISGLRTRARARVTDQLPALREIWGV